MLLILLGLVIPLAVFGFIKWLEAAMKGGQRYAKPFRIAGNLYYVGANDISSFLITGPEGHVLIDGGYPRTPSLIMASIAELGFNIRDVKVLLGDRVLNVVSACSLVVMEASRYSGYKADFERTFRILRSLPADIWVTTHARQWGRYRKFLARDTAKTPVDAFIDPVGYRAYIDSAEAQFRRGVVH